MNTYQLFLFHFEIIILFCATNCLSAIEHRDCISNVEARLVLFSFFNPLHFSSTTNRRNQPQTSYRRIGNCTSWRKVWPHWTHKHKFTFGNIEQKKVCDKIAYRRNGRRFVFIVWKFRSDSHDQKSKWINKKRKTKQNETKRNKPNKTKRLRVKVNCWRKTGTSMQLFLKTN